jgi:UDP:flavonoid glycosyltransferase YjiC (YdhE family)
MMRRLYVERAPGLLADLRPLVDGFQPDVVVTDRHCLGVRFLHEQGGPPWAIVNETSLIGACPSDPPRTGAPQPSSAPGRLRNRALNRGVRRLALRSLNHAYRDLRRSVGLRDDGLPLLDAIMSPFLFLQPTSPAFEYPREVCPRQIHLTGPMMSQRAHGPFEPPAWWDELDGDRPVVHLTQGTTQLDTDQLVRPGLEALAGGDHLVVVTVPDADAPPDLPPNARFARYIPYQELLPRVDVAISNGGYNGAHLTLANGVPMVAAGVNADQPENCARIAWTGAGIWLERPTPAGLRTAVDRVLADPAYRANAQRVAADFARHRGPDNGARLLERLVATGEPVLRPTASLTAATT